MAEIEWSRYPLVAASPHAQTWLTIRANLQLARNTIVAYGRALEEYLAFSQHHLVVADLAGREHISRYVRHLADGPTRAAPACASSTPARASPTPPCS
jgi:integrase/recombinase XerD